MSISPILFVLFIPLVILLIIWGILQSARRRMELSEWAAAKGLRFTETREAVVKPGCHRRKSVP
jgi:hypothetical protein